MKQHYLLKLSMHVILRGNRYILLAIYIQGWYEKLGDGTWAEVILDRIIYNSYDIFIDCSVSMREKFGIKETQ